MVKRFKIGDYQQKLRIKLAQNSTNHHEFRTNLNLCGAEIFFVPSCLMFVSLNHLRGDAGFAAKIGVSLKFIKQ